MTQLMPRYRHPNRIPRDRHRDLHDKLRQIEDDRQLAIAVMESGAAPDINPNATLGGDERRLRGIPVIASGVGGTSPGTNPAAAVLHSDRRGCYRP